MKQENDTYTFIRRGRDLGVAAAGLRKVEAINVNKSEWRGVLRKKKRTKDNKGRMERIISSHARE